MDKPFAGYSAKPAKEGDNVPIVYRQFLSSEDGMFFITILENLVTTIVNMLPKEANIKCSQMDHLLAFMDKEGRTKVYVNELRQVAKIRVRRDVEKGESVFEDDIADITDLKFEGIEIPENNAIIVLFSKGWRKGLYFDFSPIHDESTTIEANIWETLGSCFNYLSYQEIYSLTEEQWKFLFNEAWFPFIGFSHEMSKDFVNTIQSGWSPDTLIERIHTELSDQLPRMIDRWEKSKVFSSHIEFIKTAVERFNCGDFISATAIIYPRIEGILRTLSQLSELGSYKQNMLSSAPLQSSGIPLSKYSKVLPEKFEKYLSSVYFASFDPENPEGLSRNTVGHGVASVSDFSTKGAILGLLILEQIYFHIPAEAKPQNNENG